MDAEEELRWRSSVCPKSPIPPHLTIPAASKKDCTLLQPQLHMVGHSGTAAASRRRGCAKCPALASEECPQECPRRKAPLVAAATRRWAAASALVMEWQRLRHLMPLVKELWLWLGVRLGWRLRR